MTIAQLKQDLSVSQPLISARVISALPEAIEIAAGARFVSAAFIAAEIPQIVAERPNQALPQKSVVRFIEEAARVVGDNEFCLMIAPHLSVSKYGAWGDYVLGATTLEESLSRAIRAMPFHSSHDRLSIVADGDEVSFSYDVPVRGVVGYRQFSVCAAAVLISVIRPYLGPHWAPLRVELDIEPPSSPDRFEELFRCPMIFNRSPLAVVFQRDALSAGRKLDRKAELVSFSDLCRIASPPSPDDLPGTVKEMIRLRLLDGLVNIESVCELLAIGPRTLQRRLGDEGLEYRDLVLSVRAERASELLRETDAPITDIAMSLGYSSSAHFARAFKRAFNKTPSEIRGFGHQLSA